MTVRTPTPIVTPSAAINRARLAPSACRPGRTSLPPTAGSAKGRPHALAWNIGTTASTASRLVKAVASACKRAKRMKEARAVRIGHPLRRARRSRGKTGGRRASARRSRPIWRRRGLADQRFEFARAAAQRRAIRRLRHRSPAPALLPAHARRSIARVAAGPALTISSPRARLHRHRRQLRRGQAWVERVADAAHSHRRIPDLDMRLAVPRERRRRSRPRHAEARQQRRDRKAAFAQFRINRSARYCRPRAP